MKINKVIRKYRKDQNLTQEQLANYLGVTAPAVNKWENEVSYPDITLLAPLARILKTDIDTLLSFREELSDIEIQEYVRKISEIMQKKGFEKAFAEGDRLIKEYPACDKLVLYLTQMLQMYLSMSGIGSEAEESDLELHNRYENRIVSWYESVVSAGDDKIASFAAAALCQIYTSKKEFDKAQHLLDGIPPVGFDKRLTQASLYSNMDMKEEAYEIYETIIFKSASEICQILSILNGMYSRENKLEESDRYARLLDSVSELFGLGSFMSSGMYLNMALKKKDIEQSFELLTKLTDNALNFTNKITNSMLYTHVKFNTGEGNMKEFYNMIKKSMEHDQELDFLKSDPRFEKILARMEKAINAL